MAAAFWQKATLDWLDSILVRRESHIHVVRVDPAFDFLRGEPRYQAWESRSGLPAIAGSARPGR